MKQSVIVMGRNYTSRLGMIRATGLNNCDVYVVKTDKNRASFYKKNYIDSSSKFVKKYFCIEEPNEMGLVELLINNFSKISPKPVLIPTDDYTAAVIDKNTDTLISYFLFPNINYKQGLVIQFMDKAFQKNLAESVGFYVAKGWTAKWEDNRFEIPNEIEFPCFVKPEVSFLGSKHIMKKCDSLSELEEVLNSIEGRNGDSVLIEQYIEIEKEYDVPGMVHRDAVIIPGIIEKGMIYLGVTGTGVMHSSVEIPEIKNKLEKMLKKLDFIGLVDVEFYESNGKIYFNELNMRFGASGYAMTALGVNMPAMLIKSLTTLKSDFDYDDSKLKKQAFFVSEKVCYQLLLKKKITKNEYNKVLRDANVRFIDVKYDRKPNMIFLCKSFIAFVRRLVKN